MKLKGKKVVGLSIIAIGVLISIAVVIRSRSADQKTTGTAGLHEASFYQMLEDGLVRCELCPNRCLLKEGERGLCKVRENIGGKLYNRRREPRVYPWVNPQKYSTKSPADSAGTCDFRVPRRKACGNL